MNFKTSVETKPRKSSNGMTLVTAQLTVDAK